MTFFFSFLLRFTSYLHPCCPCHLMAAVPFRSLPCASTQDTFQASAVLLRDCPNKTFSSCRPPPRQPRRPLSSSQQRVLFCLSLNPLLFPFPPHCFLFHLLFNPVSPWTSPLVPFAPCRFPSCLRCCLLLTLMFQTHRLRSLMFNQCARFIGFSLTHLYNSVPKCFFFFCPETSLALEISSFFCVFQGCAFTVFNKTYERPKRHKYWVHNLDYTQTSLVWSDAELTLCKQNILQVVKTFKEYANTCFNNTFV